MKARIPDQLLTTAKKVLVFEEGTRYTVYQDTKGIPTFGIGHNGNKPITQHAVDLIFYDDMEDAYEAAIRIFGDRFVLFGEPRKVALLSMIFQMGEEGIRRFKRMLGAIEDGRWTDAKREALDSKWAREDSTERAKRTARMLETGEYPREYRL